MESYLKTYRVELKTVGPLFIGSGQKILKKDYILDSRTKKAHVPNLEKMFEYLSGRRLADRYLAFLSAPQYRNMSLLEWLGNNGVEEKDYLSFTAYTLDLADVDYSETRDISLFVKDAYGLPYVPGSSLKGALRTVLLGSELQKNEGRYSRLKDQIENTGSKGRNLLRDECRDLENGVFNRLNRNEKRIGDAVNDVMSGLQISDSKPLSVDVLTLCQKVDFDKENKRHTLPILRECVIPGTEIVFELTIDSNVFPYSIEDIRDAINRFCLSYDDCFVSEFAGYTNKHFLFLGGGAGYPTKTVAYSLFGKKDGLRVVSGILIKQFPKHKHNMDRGLGVSPKLRKCTIYSGKRYDMGMCRVDFRPMP